MKGTIRFIHALILELGILASPALFHFEAFGMVLDDALPGEFHHLTITPVASPQLAGRPISLVVTVRDLFGNPITNYNDGVEITASVLVQRTYQHVQILAVSNFVDGVATFAVTFTNKTTNAIVTAWKMSGAHYVTAMTSSFQVAPARGLFLSVSNLAAEGDGLFVGAGRLSLTNIDVEDVVVQLHVSDPQELAVPVSVTIPKGQTSAVFDLTIVDDERLDGSQTSIISANSPGYIGASAGMTVHDNETATLRLRSLQTNFFEGQTWANNAFELTVSDPPAATLRINLGYDDARISSGAFWFFQPGQTSAILSAYVIDDALINGPQEVTLRAHVENWVDGTATALLLDDDTNLVVALVPENKLPMEGQGLRTNLLQVRLPGTSTNSITVQLASSDPTEALVPISVTIPPGTQTILTNITFPDDDEFDGTRVATIIASAPGFASGSHAINVYDNDIHHMVFAPIPSEQTSGVPFSVTLTLKDGNDATMTFFSGEVPLTTMLNGAPVHSTPLVASNFVRGVWRGNIVVSGRGTNLQIVANAPLGTFAESNPFTIPAPAWAASVRISAVRLNYPNVQIDFDSLTGRVYRVQTAPDLNTPVWTTVGQSLNGTGGSMSITHSNEAFLPQRFYRLAVQTPAGATGASAKK